MDKKSKTTDIESNQDGSIVTSGKSTDKAKSKTLDVTITGTTTAINSGAILYLYYRFFKAEEAVNMSEKKQNMIVSNLNIVNIQLKRWISILAGQQLKTNDDIEEMRMIIMDQEERINQLEYIVLKNNPSIIGENINPIHNK